MARKSDFAQKLLDDLRKRKQRLAMSETSSRKNQMGGDAYGNTRQPSRGSRETNSKGTLRPTTKDRQRLFGTGHNRSLTMEETSKEIVTVRRGGQSSGNIADLSMALAFAVENGWTLRNGESSKNPMAGLLNQIGFGKMHKNGTSDRNLTSNSHHFPKLSHLQIKEISNGAQKLNQILKACSNGLIFETYSIEIGKELMKGAMDLEESLRMLINLQEASEYMVTPKRKQRIRLLDEDDDTSVEEIEQKQLGLPRFSFDRPSRNSRIYVRNDTKTSFLEQSMLALPYTTVTSHSNSERIGSTSSNSVSHKRSASCGPDYSSFASFSAPKKQLNSSNSRNEKGRIPSVVAKLMGLEELPPNIDSRNGAPKDSRPKQGTRAGTNLMQNAKESTKRDELKTLNFEKPAPQTTRQLQANKISIIRDTTLMLHADKILATQDATPEMVTSEGKSYRKGPKNTESLNLISDSKKSTLTIKKPQMNMMQLQESTEVQNEKQEKERKEQNSENKEQKSTEKCERKELLLKNDLQRVASQTNKHPEEAADVKQDKTGTKDSTLKKEKKTANGRLFEPSHQHKSPTDSGSPPLHTLKKSETQNAKLQTVEKEQQNVINKSSVKKTKDSSMMLKNTLKPIHDVTNLAKKLPNINHVTACKKNSTEAFDAVPSKGSIKNNHHEDVIGYGSSHLKLNMKKSPTLVEQRDTPKGIDNNVERVTDPVPLVLTIKPVNVLPRQKKVHGTKIERHESETPRKAQEVITRKIGSSRNKPQISILQELKQRKQEKIGRSKGAEAVCINKSKEAEANTQNLQERNVITPILCNPEKDQCQRPKGPETIAPNAVIQDITKRNYDSLQEPAFPLDKNLSPKSSDFQSIQLKGPQKGRSIDISNSLQQEHQKFPNSRRQCTKESLTENENHLKQKLVKSQVFLNAAEAFFKLYIPIGILHASTQKCEDEDSKLVLDCSYEIMKRKGRRQELTLYPCSKITPGSMKVKCLDNLVKELHEDLEKLKFYGGNGGDEYEAAEYLQKMLKRDIQNRNPDVNCMWDFGWSVTMFAYLEKDEVIREVEKLVLNGLLDEVTRDFLNVSISI